ncbi:MAG: DUF3990 domain-containing protein [Prevotellaceae bacterium]|jgi:hypothetical protein|nr:DUF3990 domain-containing protein [Prevotellaceae bacterium]
MKVYHGSYVEVRAINLSLGQPGRDFGHGFYVTKFREQAQVWADRKGEDNHTKGVVSEFIFDEYIWEDSELKLIRFETYSESWLDFVVQNRANRSRKQAHDFDIVEGPIADDAVTVRVNEYIRGDISKQGFLEELKFRRPTHQICFCTTASLQALEYVDCRAEWSIERVGNEVIRQIMAAKKVDEIEAADIFYTSQTFAALSSRATGLYLKPWQEIYEMLKKELQATGF